MQVKELSRRKHDTGEPVTEYEAGKLRVRLIDTYADRTPLDELLYIIACNKLLEKRA